MLIIRREQLRQIQGVKEQATLERFASRLRAEFPEQIQRLSEDEVYSQCREGWLAAKSLNVVGERDTYRFLRLRHLTGDNFASETVRHAFYKIMTDVELDASSRLDFIERHIVGRPPVDGDQPRAALEVAD